MKAGRRRATNACIRIFAVSGLLAATVAHQVHAGESGLKAFVESSVGASADSVLIVPSAVYISLFGWESQGGLLDSVRNAPKPAKAQVVAVRERKDGSREVELIGRAVAGDDGAPVDVNVVFPKREGDADAPIAMSDSLDFTPTPRGSGWTVHRSGGAAIAFLPTPQSWNDADSRRL